MTASATSIQHLSRCLFQQRRSLGSQSVERFAAVYLDHHFREPPSRMHRELFGQLSELTRHRGQRVAVAAPRGHAKTTVVSLAYVLWCMLYRKEMFILILSATREQAKQLLADLTRELRGNERLIQDFPEVCLPLIGGSRFNSRRQQISPAEAQGFGGDVKVRAHHLELPNGTCVRVLGAGQGVRGMKHGRHRPSLIIGDDLEELEATLSGEQRDKTLDWFQKTLLKAGDPRTNVVVIGTILHYDSLLANLTQDAPRRGKAGGWDGRVYRAVEAWSARGDLWDRWESIRFGEQDHEGASGVDPSRAYFEANREAMLEGTRVLWPQVEPYEKLMEIRADEGHSSFQSEKQNEPLDPDQCLFREESFRYWDDPRHPRSGGEGYVDAEDLLASLGSNRVYIYGACDPSLGERGRRGDFTAIITLVQDDKTGVMYIIGADIAKRTPQQTIDTIASLHRAYAYDAFAVETNLHHGLLANELEKAAKHRGRYLNVQQIESTRNKIARVQAIEPLVSRGMVRFSRRQQKLLEQLRQFPLGDHDDGPDALQMAIEVAMDGGPITQYLNR